MGKDQAQPAHESYPFIGPPYKCLPRGHAPRIMGLRKNADGTLSMVLGSDTRDTRPQGGVYLIRHKPSGRVYVGATGSFKVRWTVHLSALRCGIHPNKALQRDWDMCGPDAFEFVIIERMAFNRGRAALYAAERQHLAEHTFVYNGAAL